MTQSGPSPPEEPTPDRLPAWEANLTRLATLLSRKESGDRLILAEIAREWGRFGEASRILKGHFAEEHELQAAALLVLVEQGSRRVEVFDDKLFQEYLMFL